VRVRRMRTFPRREEGNQVRRPEGGGGSGAIEHILPPQPIFMPRRKRKAFPFPRSGTRGFEGEKKSDIGRGQES
jgi:hypothetical protein